jgi:two-component system OmpR family response regulator
MTVPSDGDLPISYLLLALADDIPAEPIVDCMMQAGHEVVRTNSGRQALQMTRALQPDLLILDGALDDGEGFEVCRILRSERVETPAILLTVEDSAIERVQGLNLGADDCLSRTSALGELTARVAVVLQRGHPSSRTLLRCGPVTLDATAHRVSRKGSWIHLQPTEFRLLTFFLRNLNVDLDRALLIEQLWGSRFSGDYGLLSIAVSSLRDKVDVGHPKLIHTIRGVGYRMTEPVVMNPSLPPSGLTQHRVAGGPGEYGC